MADQQPRLTPRQREVLEQLARGRTNPEIAAELGIGFETVKMHVSDVLAELHVSSREEAADWWRRSRRPAARMRALVPTAFALRWAAGGALAAGATAGMAVFVVAASGGGTTPTAAPDVAATPSPAAVGPSSTPIAQPPTAEPTNQVDVGWEAAAAALRFRLLDFRADALHTEVTLEIEGSMRETGDAQVYVTDSAGQRQRLQPTSDFSREAAGVRPGRYGGFVLAPGPGNVTIDVSPVRDYVIPPLATGDSLPVWASFTIPWTGYTDAAREVALPSPARRPLGGGTAVIDRILRSPTTVRVEWHIENASRIQAGTVPDVWAQIVTTDGMSTLEFGQGGGSSQDSDVIQGDWEFYPNERDQEREIILVLIARPPFRCNNVTPTPDGGGICVIEVATPGPTYATQLDALRASGYPMAEFRVTLPPREPLATR